MVYRGPSRGCATCRKRRVKCDLNEPACHNCQRSKLFCPGLKPEAQFAIQDETSEVIKRQQLQRNRVLHQSTVDTKSHNRNELTQDVLVLSEALARRHKSGTEPILVSPAGTGYDPFGALAIEINHDVNDLLVFWRSYLAASLPEQTSPHSQALKRSAWDLSIDALHDYCQGCAFIVVAAATRESVTSFQGAKGLLPFWSAKALQGIRSLLAIDYVSCSVLGYVQTILASEIAARQHHVALIHAKFLAAVLQLENGQATPFPLGVIHAFAWLETHRATSAFTHPLFSPYLYDLHVPADASIALKRKFNTCIAHKVDLEALADLSLSTLFTQMQQFADVLRGVCESQSEVKRSPSVALSLSALRLSSCLLVYSVDTSKKALCGQADDLSELHVYQVGAASLAALYCMRLITGSEVSGTNPGFKRNTEMVFAEGPRIVLRIRTLLEKSESLFNSMLQDHERQCKSIILQPLNNDNSLPPPPFLRLRLWILYVSSFIERTHSVDNTESEVTGSWHQNQFLSLIHRAGLQEQPEQLQDIVARFFDLKEISSRIPYWFSPVLRTWAFAAERHSTALQ